MVAFAVACAPALPSRQAQHLGSLRASRRIAAPAGAPAGLAPRRRQVPAGGQSRPAVSQSRPTLPQAISRDFGPELSFDDFDFPKAIDDSPYGDPYVRSSAIVASVKSELAALQAEVEAARAALQDTRLALNDAEAPGGSASERQRLRAQLAQQAEAIDTASVQLRMLEGRLEEARAERTSAYAAKISRVASAMAAKHFDAQPYSDTPALEAAVVELQRDLEALQDTAIEATAIQSQLHTRFERVRAMGDKWHARAAELSTDNKLRKAAEARACSAALGSRAALLQEQLSLLSQAVREVKRCVGELDDQLTRTRAERDTARAADAASLAATAADLPAPLLERRLAALRAAAEEVGSARQELQSRHDVAAGTADFWVGWADKLRRRGEDSQAESAIRRGAPHAATAAALRRQLNQTSEAANSLALSIRILEARLEVARESLADATTSM